MDWNSFAFGAATVIGLGAIVLGFVLILNGVYENGRRDGREEGRR